MKRAILIAMTVVAALSAPVAGAEKTHVTVLIAGGSEANTIVIGLSPDGRTYLIDSVVELEIGGEVCWHPEGQPTELLCEASAIGGFEVNAGGGDDQVVVAASVPVAVTLRGGPGDDRLVGGAGSDKIVGGSGHDILAGHAGSDSLFGGTGSDRLFGGSGDDTLVGNGGGDVLRGGPGHNSLIP